MSTDMQYRDIAAAMNENGEKISYTSARSIFIHGVAKFLRRYLRKWHDVSVTREISIEWALKPEVQEVVSDLLHGAHVITTEQIRSAVNSRKRTKTITIEEYARMCLLPLEDIIVNAITKYGTLEHWAKVADVDLGDLTTEFIVSVTEKEDTEMKTRTVTVEDYAKRMNMQLEDVLVDAITEHGSLERWSARAGVDLGGLTTEAIVGSMASEGDRNSLAPDYMPESDEATTVADVLERGLTGVSPVHESPVQSLAETRSDDATIEKVVIDTQEVTPCVSITSSSITEHGEVKTKSHPRKSRVTVSAESLAQEDVTEKGELVNE